MWDVIVVGGANSDYLVRGDRLPVPGETLEGHTFQEAPGGKGANQAVAAARLGARVALVARIGRDARGDEIAARLTAEGVDTRYLTRDAEAATGVALILVGGDGQKEIFTAPGANRRVTVADVEAAASALRATRTVLSQLEVPPEVVGRAFQLGREGGSRTVLDPAPAVPLTDDLLRRVDVIRPNASEATLLTGMTVHDRETARRAAAELRRRGSGAAVVQAGDEGNLLVWSDGEVWLPKLPVASIDATGAGDAFAAGLAVLLAEGRPLPEAATFGNACAALATTVLGAQAGLPRRDAVLALLGRNA
jgi:ribokinase